VIFSSNLSLTEYDVFAATRKRRLDGFLTAPFSANCEMAGRLRYFATNARDKEADMESAGMESIVGFLGVGCVIAISIGLALGLEWLSLRALMHLMPGEAADAAAGRTAVANVTASGRLAAMRSASEQRVMGTWASGRWAVPVPASRIASMGDSRAFRARGSQATLGQVVLP
jgi:hypothetical protein